jgi:hypothetical protein
MRAVGSAPFAYLAVETAEGPHVTPLLFAATPDRLWFGIGRRTFKARAVARRRAVAVVVPGEEASAAIRGVATLLDRIPASPSELARAPFALPAFAARNAFEMAAFARDVARGAQPQSISPVSVRIDSLDLFEDWQAQAALGWMTPAGLIAVPATWDPRTERAHAPAAPFRQAGGPADAPACVCIDESEGLGPLAKRGRLLRGRGHVTLNGDVASVELDPDRVTRWKGFQTETAAA